MYGIFRVKKYKRTACYPLQLERERTSNDGRNFAYSDINKELSDNNIHIIQTDSWNRAITKRLKEEGIKERKDSNVLLGAVYTATAEYFEQHPEDVIKYFQDCFDFHISEYCQGDLSRVLDCTIDVDETSIHMQIYNIPLCEKEGQTRLSAKDLVGDRYQLRAAQDKFYDQVCQSRGLQRGEKVDWDMPYKERKKHQRTRDYKRMMDEKQREQLTKDVARLSKAKATLTAHCKEMIDKTEKLFKDVKDELLKEDALEFVLKGSFREYPTGEKVFLEDVFKEKWLPNRGHVQTADYQDLENTRLDLLDAYIDSLDDIDNLDSREQ